MIFFFRFVFFFVFRHLFWWTCRILCYAYVSHHNGILLVFSIIPNSMTWIKMFFTLQAAPPLIIDFTKMPRSAWFSLERFPLTLTPSPAEPESLSGISKVRNSLVPSGVRTNSSSSVLCWNKKGKKDKIISIYFTEHKNQVFLDLPTVN